MFGRGRERGVHVGRDGWLFWLGETGHLPTFYANDLRALWRIARWRRRIAARSIRAKALGARYLQVFAPDKLSVYADRLARRLVRPEHGLAARLARGGAPVVDLAWPLKTARATAETYLRTDTHWTHHGYVTAYRTLCAALDTEPAAHVLETRPPSVSQQLFDLGSKLDPPVFESYAAFDFPRRARRIETNALVEHRERLHGGAFAAGLMVGSRLVLANDSPGVDPRRVMLFGDSYAFHPGGLADMLAESFAEVHALWSGAIDWRQVERTRPDILIHELAERFFHAAPRDGVDLEAFATARLADAPAGQTASPAAASA